MKLAELLQFVPHEEVKGNTQTEITGLAVNSKIVQEGQAFICYRGGNADGHHYVQEAVERGAVCVVCERELDLPPTVTQVLVKDGRKSATQLARAFYGFADQKLQLIAVVGTNGKTTTTYMLRSIFQSAGKKVGVIGTLGIVYGDKTIAPELTTPDPIFLHEVLADMVQSGVEVVCMEVSAHAIWFGKTEGITFRVGIFTNCTQDHLDFFQDFATYAQCKKSFFLGNACQFAVVNADDKLGLELIRTRKKCFSYGLQNPADVFAVNITETESGSSFVLNVFDSLYDIDLGMPALFNVYNAMGASACACLMGISLSAVAEGLQSLHGVAGRLEYIGTYHGARIYVDFAHTPDGLEKSLTALRKLCKGKLICLFGCGGNRDKTKRPLMGKIASTLADFCVVTSDNPRYEDPYDIIAQIESGMQDCGLCYVGITEREVATEYAIRLLEEGDILLVAGKGGENYQEVMGIKHHYNDNTVIKKLIG
jgi:UDP-N-acetylmuramoyl-L-alanyl-D-glutamate--2,6-diaminopimelate ligase